MSNHLTLIHHRRVDSSSDMKSLLYFMGRAMYVIYRYHLINPLTHGFSKKKLMDPLTLEIKVDRSVNLNCLFLELTNEHIEVASVQKINKLE